MPAVENPVYAAPIQAGGQPPSNGVLGSSPKQWLDLKQAAQPKLSSGLLRFSSVKRANLLTAASGSAEPRVDASETPPAYQQPPAFAFERQYSVA